MRRHVQVSCRPRTVYPGVRRIRLDEALLPVWELPPSQSFWCDSYVVQKACSILPLCDYWPWLIYSGAWSVCQSFTVANITRSVSFFTELKGFKNFKSTLTLILLQTLSVREWTLIYNLPFQERLAYRSVYIRLSHMILFFFSYILNAGCLNLFCIHTNITPQGVCLQLWGHSFNMTFAQTFQNSIDESRIILYHYFLQLGLFLGLDVLHDLFLDSSMSLALNSWTVSLFRLAPQVISFLHPDRIVYTLSKRNLFIFSLNPAKHLTTYSNQSPGWKAHS